VLREGDWDEINVLIAGDNASVRGNTGRILGKEREVGGNVRGIHVQEAMRLTTTSKSETATIDIAVPRRDSIEPPGRSSRYLPYLSARG